jgi:hypothetical protein
MPYDIESNFSTIIIATILGSGILGGVTNFVLVIDKDKTRLECWILFWRSLLVSICAALTVPLFLQILSNNILDTYTLKTCLVFGSFCVLASFFSRRFLDDVYARIEKKVEENVEKKLEGKVDDIKQQAQSKLNIVEKEFTKKVDDLAEDVQTFEDKEQLEETNIDRALKGNILDGANVKKVIEAFKGSKFTYRTIAGIAQSIKEPESEVKRTVEYLEHMGLLSVKGLEEKYYKYLKYPIKIYSASYGVNGNTVDVTEKMKYFASKEIFKGSVSPANLGVQDPAFGQTKILKIHCRIYGIEKELTFADGHQFDLELSFPDVLKSYYTAATTSI